MPLSDLKVVELGHALAGPWAGAVLGWYGAEVIKVESPRGGDPIRGWRTLDETGTSLWWRSVARNKRCAAIDLRHAEGRALVRQLIDRADILIENFRPGTLEGWGLGPEALWSTHPGLIIARVSGYGQTGPYASRSGYASVCEAVGGLRHLTGHPGQPTVRSNLSLADTAAGLQAVIGILTALRHRDKTGCGQVVDVALTETVLAMLEAVIPEYAHTGVSRGPSGGTITGLAPTNAYPTVDGQQVVIGANSGPTFARLCEAIGRPELPRDPRFATNADRWANREALDTIIAAWTGALPATTVVARCTEAHVPAGPIQDAAAIVADPQVQARGVLEQIEGEGGPVLLPSPGPRLSLSPGHTHSAGPPLGAHTLEVLEEIGLRPEALDRLAQAGVIRQAPPRDPPSTGP